MPAEPALAVDEIQGNVLPGFNTRHQVLLGVRFASSREARTWLRGILPSVSTLGEVNAVRDERRAAALAGRERPVSPVFASVAFDVGGLRLLAPAVSGMLDGSFPLGMGTESDLGDPQDPAHAGHPRRWVVGGAPDRTPHALVILGGDDLAALRARCAAIDARDVAAVYDEEGHMLDGDVEHFGFRDGLSQVGVRGTLPDGSFFTRRYLDAGAPRAERDARPGQPLVWPGQFVFGYPKQRADDPVRPGPAARGGYGWMDNGSYLVFRRLRQDVAAFARFLAEEAARLPGMTPARFGALVVGRWPGGTPVVRNAGGDDPEPPTDRFAVNDFTFGDDRFGRLCPAFAHIRKVNPRDLPTDKGGPDRTLTFAVLRRGIPYGPPFPAEGERGLLFMSYQTSIRDQFEVLNTDWMNRVHGPEGDGGHDLLVGQGAGTTRERTAHLREPAGRIVTRDEWVLPTGGGYFFAPSLSALRSFAAPDVVR